MANEVTNALLVTNGGRTAEVLAGVVAEALHDPTDLRAAMRYMPFMGQGSATMELLVDAAPGAAAAMSTEIASGASNSAYTTAGVALTIAGYTRQHQVSDLLGITAGGGGVVDANRVAQKLSRSLGLTMTDLVTALFSALNGGTGVGTSGVNLTVSDLYSAMYTLMLANVPFGPADPAFLVLHPQQYTDFLASLRGETGSDSLQAETAAQLRFSGPGYKGMWKNIAVWTSDSCPTANAAADRVGAMFGSNAFAYTLGNMLPLVGTHIDPSDVLVATPEIIVERRRVSANDPLSTLIAHFYPGVAELIDAAGVPIVTDA